MPNKTHNRMSDQERMRASEEKQAGADASHAAQKMATSAVHERLQNPEFLDKLRDEDVDNELFPWISDELGPMLSGAHIIGNRAQDYEREAKWLDMNEGERLVAEANPGRLLRENESVLRIAQGAHKDDVRYRPPAQQDEKRVIRDAMEVSTNLKTLAVGAKGLESVTTATAENRVVRNDQEDTSTTRAKIRSYFE